MPKGPVRFTSQWVLVGVILFYTVGTVIIARHTKRIFKPASAGGSEHREYSTMPGTIPETPVRSISVVTEHWQQNNPSGLINWNGKGSNLMFGNIDLGNGLFNQDVNTSDTSGLQDDSEKVDDEEKEEEEKPAQQELTKIQAERKSVERILRKADIEPYYRDGQINGLQITGLDEKTEAEAVFLKNGDVILAVNGQTLSSKKEAYDIFIDARKEPIMIIDLLQKGQTNKYLLDFQ
jgi:hypothetical protein